MIPSISSLSTMQGRFFQVSVCLLIFLHIFFNIKFVSPIIVKCDLIFIYKICYCVGWSQRYSIIVITANDTDPSSIQWSNMISHISLLLRIGVRWPINFSLSRAPSILIHRAQSQPVSACLFLSFILWWNVFTNFYLCFNSSAGPDTPMIINKVLKQLFLNIRHQREE